MINNSVNIANKQPQTIYYTWACNSLTQQPIKTKLGTHMLFLNEHTEIVMVNIAVNNAVLVKKHPQAIHLAISETGRCRKTKFGEVIVTYTSDD